MSQEEPKDVPEISREELTSWKERFMQMGISEIDADKMAQEMEEHEHTGPPSKADLEQTRRKIEEMGQPGWYEKHKSEVQDK